MVKRRFKLRPQVPLEQDEQANLFQWAAAAVHRYPELSLLFAVPNGMPLGANRFAIMNWAKRRGLRPGVPDCFLLVPRAGFHGLAIEMKRIKGSVNSRDQDWWLEALRKQGYKAEYCHGFKEAAETITQYLLGGPVAQPIPVCDRCGWVKSDCCCDSAR